MVRKEVVDKLAEDTVAARAAGMSYGKWKAMQRPVVIERKKPKEYFKRYTCVYCGVEIISLDNRTRKYCGIECRRKDYSRKYSQGSQT